MDISPAIANRAAITVARGQTIRIAARPGRIVHCVSGQIWLTQYGVFDDYFLPGGTSYRSSAYGLILVNSCQDLSVVSVRSHVSEAGIDLGRVRIESPIELDSEARRYRASLIAAMINCGRGALARWWRRRPRVLERAR
jgi:hypothetical protein